MATINDPRAEDSRRTRRRPWPRRDGVFRFTIDQYYELDELGYFEDRHVELIEGVIYEMTVHPPHATATALAAEALRGHFAAGWLIRQEKPLDVGRRSLPEPDLAVVPGTIRDYAEAHPASCALVVEISGATLRKDRSLKAHLYAQAKFADYWIVNLIDRQLEILRNPGPNPSRKGRFTYTDVTIVPADGHASPLARPEVRIAVADLLP